MLLKNMLPVLEAGFAFKIYMCLWILVNYRGNKIKVSDYQPI